MSKQGLFGIIAVIVLLIVAGIVYANSRDNQQDPASNGALMQEEFNSDTNDIELLPIDQSPATAPSGQSADGRFSGEDDIMAPDVAVHEISFSGTAFSPANLTIKNGDIVVFKNNSNKNFWPASAPHPQHTDYPEFDAKKEIAPGGLYQFKFTKTGAWGFHDHRTPTAFGRITVQ